MATDCITLSSDSSRPSSPYFNELLNEHENNSNQQETALNTDERYQRLETLDTDRTETNFYSLSDSNSERSISPHNSLDILVTENLDDFSIERKRKGQDNLQKENKRKKTAKPPEKEDLKAAKEYQRSLQPKECIKYVTAIVDTSVLHYNCMRNVEEKLLEREVKFSIRSNAIQGTVIWNRKLFGVTNTRENSSEKEEEHVLLCLELEEIIKMMSEEMLVSHVAAVKDALSGKSLTLVLCGATDYLHSAKGRKNKRQSQKPSRKSMEESLVKMQIMFGVGHRSVEDSSEFASLLALFTKSVAETPFKREKHERERSGILSWFAQGDSKDCVRVTNAGHGCLLLWQQQLRQFNNVGLDVAKAVASSYSSPQALLTAYKKCKSVEDAEKLLQNIQVHRRCGPLSSMRRIGPELSRKICIFLTSFTGNQYLSEN